MSKRFSRKEFIAALRFDPYSWRTTLGIVWKLLLAAALLWIFPMEKYGIEPGSGKWYSLGFLVLAVFMAWDLLRKRSTISFNACPNCGKRILIRLGSVGLEKMIVSFPSAKAVSYRDGICPHCRTCVWNEETESRSFKFTESQFREAANRIAEPRYILAVVVSFFLFVGVLSGALAGLVKLFRMFDAPAPPVIFCLIASVFLLGRYFSGMLLKYSPLPSCPACGKKSFDTEIELKTGRCHNCGELIIDENDI